MNDKQQQSAQQWLDQRSAQLGKKHDTALNAMTGLALRPKPRLHFFTQYKPALAIAFSVLVIMGVMLNVNDSSQINTEVKMAALPAWVSDTQVPVPVIEQLKFYTWLAQHIDDDNELRQKISKNKASKTDAAWGFELGYRQQFAALDAP